MLAKSRYIVTSVTDEPAHYSGYEFDSCQIEYRGSFRNVFLYVL